MIPDLYEIIAAGIPEESPLDIPLILEKEEINEAEFLALLSQRALPYIEPMARKAGDLTLRHFGRAISLYTPLYISNYCDNECLYCGFNRENIVRRKRLSIEELKKEAGEINRTGIQNILLLTGDSTVHSPLSYIIECAGFLKTVFSSIAVEIYPLQTDGYRQLVACGVDGLTLYQETYDERLYSRLHVSGPKRDYRFRLEGPGRGCSAGMRQVNIGALLGLGDVRQEIFSLGLHARWLQHNYPDVEIGFSLPRLKKHEGVSFEGSPVTDRQFVQMMLALRLFLPRAPMAISTREPYSLRRSLIGLGVTRMSAGSRTEVGGYVLGEKTEGQFEVEDKSSVEEVMNMIAERGYQAVLKDWEPLL